MKNPGCPSRLPHNATTFEATNTVQELAFTITGSPTGAFTLSLVGSATTGAISFSTDSATLVTNIQNALTAASWPVSSNGVTGTVASIFINFNDGLSHPVITANTSSLTGVVLVISLEASGRNQFTEINTIIGKFARSLDSADCICRCRQQDFTCTHAQFGAVVQRGYRDETSDYIFILPNKIPSFCNEAVMLAGTGTRTINITTKHKVVTIFPCDVYWLDATTGLQKCRRGLALGAISTSVFTLADTTIPDYLGSESIRGDALPAAQTNILIVLQDSRYTSDYAPLRVSAGFMPGTLTNWLLKTYVEDGDFVFQDDYGTTPNRLMTLASIDRESYCLQLQGGWQNPDPDTEEDIRPYPLSTHADLLPNDLLVGIVTYSALGFEVFSWPGVDTSGIAGGSDRSAETAPKQTDYMASIFWDSTAKSGLLWDEISDIGSPPTLESLQECIENDSGFGSTTFPAQPSGETVVVFYFYYFRPIHYWAEKDTECIYTEDAGEVDISGDWYSTDAGFAENGTVRQDWSNSGGYFYAQDDLDYYIPRIGNASWFDADSKRCEITIPLPQGVPWLPGTLVSVTWGGGGIGHYIVNAKVTGRTATSLTIGPYYNLEQGGGLLNQTAWSGTPSGDVEVIALNNALKSWGSGDNKTTPYPIPTANILGARRYLRGTGKLESTFIPQGNYYTYWEFCLRNDPADKEITVSFGCLYSTTYTIKATDQAATGTLDNPPGLNAYAAYAEGGTNYDQITASGSPHAIGGGPNCIDCYQWQDVNQTGDGPDDVKMMEVRVNGYWLVTPKAVFHYDLGDGLHTLPELSDYNAPSIKATNNDVDIYLQRALVNLTKGGRMIGTTDWPPTLDNASYSADCSEYPHQCSNCWRGILSVHLIMCISGLTDTEGSPLPCSCGNRCYDLGLLAPFMQGCWWGVMLKTPLTISTGAVNDWADAAAPCLSGEFTAALLQLDFDGVNYVMRLWIVYKTFGSPSDFHTLGHWVHILRPTKPTCTNLNFSVVPGDAVGPFDNYLCSWSGVSIAFRATEGNPAPLGGTPTDTIDASQSYDRRCVPCDNCANASWTGSWNTSENASWTNDWARGAPKNVWLTLTNSPINGSNTGTTAVVDRIGYYDDSGTFVTVANLDGTYKLEHMIDDCASNGNIEGCKWLYKFPRTYYLQSKWKNSFVGNCGDPADDYYTAGDTCPAGGSPTLSDGAYWCTIQKINYLLWYASTDCSTTASGKVVLSEVCYDNSGSGYAVISYTHHVDGVVNKCEGVYQGCWIDYIATCKWYDFYSCCYWTKPCPDDITSDDLSHCGTFNTVYSTAVVAFTSPGGDIISSPIYRDAANPIVMVPALTENELRDLILKFLQDHPESTLGEISGGTECNCGNRVFTTLKTLVADGLVLKEQIVVGVTLDVYSLSRQP